MAKNSFAYVGMLNPCAEEFIPFFPQMSIPIFMPIYASPPISYPSYFAPPPSLHNPPSNIFTELNAAPITYNIRMNYIAPMAPPLPPPIPAFCNPVNVPAMSLPSPVSVEIPHFVDTNNNAHGRREFNTLDSAFLMGKQFVPQPSEWPQEQQSRTLRLSLVPAELGPEELQKELEAWGFIRELHIQNRNQGCVTVDFFDIRSANKALNDIRRQHMIQQRMLQNIYKGKQVLQQPATSLGLIGGKPVWAQYAEPTAHNQGTLVVFNLDNSISRDYIRSIFQAYGTVKEVRAPSSKSHVKFVEFFDVRDAQRAQVALDGQEIGSTKVKVQFSHFHGRTRRWLGHPTIQKPPPRFEHYKRQAEEENSICEKLNEVKVLGESSSQFAFNETEAQSNNTQARTTVMIKNIPNKYDQRMLLELLDNHCRWYNHIIADADEPRSEFDFVYLPIDFKNQCNLGYAFVNFTSAKSTSKLYRAFHLHQWTVFKSKKICEITYAKIQGLSCLEEHFRKTKFACDRNEYLPMVFSPPRTGENFTVPKFIGRTCNWQSDNKDSHYRQQEQHQRRFNGVVPCRQFYYKPKTAQSQSELNPQDSYANGEQW